MVDDFRVAPNNEHERMITWGDAEITESQARQKVVAEFGLPPEVARSQASLEEILLMLQIGQEIGSDFHFEDRKVWESLAIPEASSETILQDLLRSAYNIPQKAAAGATFKELVEGVSAFQAIGANTSNQQAWDDYDKIRSFKDGEVKGAINWIHKWGPPNGLDSSHPSTAHESDSTGGTSQRPTPKDPKDIPDHEPHEPKSKTSDPPKESKTPVPPPKPEEPKPKEPEDKDSSPPPPPPTNPDPKTTDKKPGTAPAAKRPKPAQKPGSRPVVVWDGSPNVIPVEEGHSRKPIDWDAVETEMCREKGKVMTPGAGADSESHPCKWAKLAIRIRSRAERIAPYVMPRDDGTPNNPHKGEVIKIIYKGRVTDPQGIFGGTPSRDIHITIPNVPVRDVGRNPLGPRSDDPT